MIVGVGVGLVDGDRFAAALARRGERLPERVFTPAERASGATGPARARSLGARLAAKAAARRALGLERMAWRDAEVVRRERAAPELRLHGAALDAARRLGVTDVRLTLSHDAGCCIGQVILQRGAP